MSILRDREGEFEPQLIKPHQRRFTGFDELVLSLYGKGMTVGDIQSHVEETYGSEVSKGLISAITDGLKGLPETVEAAFPETIFKGVLCIKFVPA